MPVPSVLTDLTVSEATNSPPDTETVTPTTRPSDYLRAHASLIRRMRAQGAAVASAATVDLGAITDGEYLNITGVVTITSFGTIAAGVERTLVFTGILILTHNATSLILRTGANRTTAVGDVAVFVSEGAGNWREKAYHTAAGSFQPLDAELTTLAAITAQQATDLASVSTFMGTVLNDANQAAALTTLGAQLNATVALAAAYTVVAADRGKLFDCSGTFAITLTAAATLGAGFSFAVRNSGTGIVTLDPNAAELVDGVATITYAAGVSSLVTCNGTAFKTVGLAEVADGSITAPKLSGAQTGTAPIYAARAWVNFNGTGTVAIRASGNVSSITDNGVGDTTVNFTTAMSTADYAMTTAGLYTATDSNYKLTFFATATPATTTSVRVFSSGATNAAASDSVINCISIFR